jgi:hypothetical protein
VTGRLIDLQGKAVAGASVSMWYLVDDSPGIPMPNNVAETNAEGRFRVEGIFSGKAVRIVIGSAEAARLVPSYREHVDEFTRALAKSAETGEPLRVELTPPGHVDFGWVTTFVHRPRCKAEGPVLVAVKCSRERRH